MIIKEKRWLSRLVAMLCVLTMVVGVLTPASVGVATGKDVTRIIIKVLDGVNYYDEDTNDMKDATEKIEIENYAYSYKSKQNIIEITPADSARNFGNLKTIYFNIEMEEKPEIKPEIKIENENTKIKQPSIVNNYDGSWKIGIPISASATKGEITVTPIIQYSVTYNAGTGCNITDETGSKSLAGTTQSYSGGNIKFKANLINAADKENKTLSVILSDLDGSKPVSLTETDGIYSITDLDKNKMVVVTAVDITHKVTLATNTGKEGYRYSSYDGTDIVTHNGTFRFYVTPIEGYEVPEVYVVNKNNPTEDDLNEEAKLNSVGGNLYVCNNITQDKFIYIKNVSINKYNVHFSVGTGYTVKGINEENNKITDNYATVSHGDNLKFKINATTGYDKPTVIANNNKVISLAGDEQEGYTGTLESVKEDTVVTINGNKKAYNVSFAEDSKPEEQHSGYICSGETATVSHGDKYTFYVTPAEGYSRPIVTINESPDPINPVDGSRYEITITGETTIKIQAGAKDTRTVTFTDGIGYNFSNWEIIGEGPLSGDDKIKNVPYGEGIKFKVKLNDYYSDSNMLVLANGTKLEKEGDYYKLENITKDQTITVSGVEKPVYTVTFTQGESYTISSTEPTKVTAGEYFTFTVSVTAGYEGTLDVKVNKDSVEDDDEDGYYKVQITENTVIRAEGLTQKFYKPAVKNKNNEDDINANVEFTKPDGVAYREKCEFTVKPNPYYKLVQVAYDGTQLTPVGDKYTIPSVTDSDAIITVVTEPVKLTVHYVDDIYNNSDTVTYTYDGSGYNKPNLIDPKKEELALYTFEKWLNDENAVYKDHVDSEVTVTASWKLNETVISEALGISTEGIWGKSGELAKITFRSTIKKMTNDLSEEYRAKVHLTGCGTLYSFTEININEKDEDVKKAILNRNGSPDPGATLNKTVFNNNKDIYNYYSDVDLTMDSVGEDGVFSLNLTMKNQIERHAKAWIELTIDGDKDNKVIVWGEDQPLYPE